MTAARRRASSSTWDPARRVTGARFAGLDTAVYAWLRVNGIRDTTLLAIEGERDATCPPGQTRAALDLCPALGPEKKRHHLQRGAGHDDLFEGPTWATEIYPGVVREVIRSSG